MTITPRSIDQFQYSDSINRRYWDSKYVFETFQQNGATSAVGGGAASGTAQAKNVLMLATTDFEYDILGTQTITAPVITASGLDLGSMDQTAGDGLELNHGVLASQVPAMVIGSDPAFFLRARFQITDVSGTTACLVGWRKCQAPAAAFATYTDFAGINVNAGDIILSTQKATGGVVTTDTTQNWADNETHELIINVDGSGNVTYTIDGVAPTVTAAYQFTAALTVMPFFFFAQASDLTNLPLMIWEAGWLLSNNNSPNPS